MIEAGADIIVAHLGLTTGGSVGVETALRLEDCPQLIHAWAEPARKCARMRSSGVTKDPFRRPRMLSFREYTCFHGPARWSACRSRPRSLNRSRAFEKTAFRCSMQRLPMINFFPEHER
jgi:hypothetical protein